MTFSVNRKQLDTASKSFADLHTAAEDNRSTLNGVDLTQADFGRVPWLQTRVWEAYTEHRHACDDSLQQLSGALQNVSEGLTATSAAYRQMDDDAERAAEYITQSMQAGPQ